MKTALRFSILTLCLVLFTGITAFRVHKDSPPQIRFTEQNFDFGNIKAGDVVEHEFEYTNLGDQELKIIKVVTGCDCLTYDYPSTPLKKNEKAKMKITYNSTGKTGAFVKTILIDNNTPGGAIRLMVKAKVEAGQ